MNTNDELVKEIRQRFEIFSKLAHSESWSNGLLEAYVALRDVIKRPVSEEQAVPVLAAFDTPFRQQLEDAYNLALMKYEYDIVERLEGRITWQQLISLPDFLYVPDFLRLALVEYRHAGLADNVRDRMNIIFVGGGSFPITPLSFVILDSAREQGRLGNLSDLLMQPFSPAVESQLKEMLESILRGGICKRIQIVTLDRDPQAIAAARGFLESLELLDQVSYQHRDVGDYVLEHNVEAIIFAASIPNKRIIIPGLLTQLECTTPVRLVFRTVPEFSLRSLLYEPLPQAYLEQLADQFPRLRLCDRIEPDMAGLITTTTVSIEYLPKQ